MQDVGQSRQREGQSFTTACLSDADDVTTTTWECATSTAGHQLCFVSSLSYKLTNDGPTLTLDRSGFQEILAHRHDLIVRAEVVEILNENG